MSGKSNMALGTEFPFPGSSKSSIAIHAMLRWSLLTVGLAVLLFMQSVHADVAIRVQAQPIADPIQAFVTVTDATTGSPVGNLTAADFTVRVDGVVLSPPPTFALPPGGSAQNVSVVFAMDYSSSVQTLARDAMEQAVIAFINLMQPGDYAAIVKFNTTNSNQASVVRAFTQIDGGVGTQALIQAVQSNYPGAGTNIFDAIVVSVGQFTAPPVPLPSGPRAIILVSDGGENKSTNDINAAVAAAVDASISIFTVGVGDFTSTTSQQILNNLANETNGDFYPAPTTDEIGGAYVQISQLLNNEYLLTFNSSITGCLTHTLDVAVVGQASGSANFTRCTELLAPDVRGMTQAAATTALTDAGLGVGTVTQQASSTVPAGSVVSQNPVVGSVVLPGSNVNLVVSNGPPLVAVPNVVGQTQAAATATLTGAGLVSGTVTQQSSSTVASGSVISQNPAAGSQVAAGVSVSLVVSSGPAQPSGGGGGGGGATGPLELLAGLLLAGLLRRRRNA